MRMLKSVKVYCRGIIALLLVIAMANPGFADIPGRRSPAGTAVPNPGVQQQELPNITFPAPYNVFEFVVTCMACHGGSIDQTAAQGGNWAGTSMASSARDPIFRANQLIVNNSIKKATGTDAAGNICMRCHSPNGWTSGRFDPNLGGAVDGSTMINSIVLSTDAEGIHCEVCHRAIGAATMQRNDLDPNDPVWKMMAGAAGEWPHAGNAFPQGPGSGNPFGDATLQFHDGMSYGGKYGGNVETSFYDLPFTGTYTGQTYGTVPSWFLGDAVPPPAGMPATDALGNTIAYNPDGTVPFIFETGVLPDPNMGAISPEHSTRANEFVKSPEFCGACHDLTIPVLNHGMPEQRTYTEWKYSDFGRGAIGLPVTRCQDCHMPVMKHEYADNTPVSINPDPILAGWYPYARDRNPNGGTSFHKFAGANRDLSMMMKLLYPEVDMELIGAPTGHDPTIFPGMLSDRGPMWDRNHRNTDISLRNAVDVQLTSGPTYNPLTEKWEVKVKVTNKSGHKVPSGYPDGRRMWISLVVKDAAGNDVYESGYNNAETATLTNSRNSAVLKRSTTPTIDGADNAVMIYEKRTGSSNGNGTYAVSVSLLNDKILFDNRIPPRGFTYSDYSGNGAAFWTYTGTESQAVPMEDGLRYADGQNWDEVTYTFTGPPPGAVLSAKAEVYYQSHTREQMEFLKNELNKLEDELGVQTPRPQGGPSILEQNYPLTPSYISDSFTKTTGKDFTMYTDLDGNPVRDNWAGIAYASWMETGKGAPYLMDADNTALTGPPVAPFDVAVYQAYDQALGIADPNAQKVVWNAVPGADGYLVWVRYGAAELTSSWDRLAFTTGNELLHQALNPAKTFAYKIQAFNAKGFSVDSPVIASTTPEGVPFVPTSLRVNGVAHTTVDIAWYDQADNEIGFVIERQEVPVDPMQALQPYEAIAIIPSSTVGGTTGGNFFTDADQLPQGGSRPVGYTYVPLQPGRTYNYQVRSYNNAGQSAPCVPAVSATTLGYPFAPGGLTATAVSGYQVDLAWTDNSANESGFRIERALDAGFTQGLTTYSTAAGVVSYSDTTEPVTTYWYRVFAVNNFGSSQPSNDVSVTTPEVPPSAPGNLAATASAPGPNMPTVGLTWTDTSNNETGFRVERALDAGFTNGLTTFTVGGGVTVYTDSTPAPETTYFYRVFATNIAGSSPESNVVNVTTAPIPPGGPINLTATPSAPGPNMPTVGLTWTDNSNNETGFRIERATDAAFTQGLTTSTVAAGAASYTDTTPVPETTYYYRVFATNTAGSSPESNVVNVTTAPIPPAGPGLLSATPSAPGVVPVTVALAWTDNSNNETGFRIERALDAGFTQGLFTFGAGAGATSYVDSAPPDSTFFYRVIAYNAAGNSPESNVANATTPPLRPEGPTNLVAAASKLSWNPPTVSLTWTDNSNNETSFIISRRLSNGGVFADIANLPPGTTSFQDTAVVPETAYTYRVYASNISGLSRPSNAGNVTTPGVLPVGPANLVASASGLSSNPPMVSLTWTDNSNNETGFIVSRRLSNGGVFADVANLPPGTISYPDTAVEPKTAYTYRVYAVNGSGLSRPSNAGNVTTPGVLPAMPSGLTVTETTTDSATISWVDNSNNETGFSIWEKEGDGPYVEVLPGAGANATNFTRTGLKRWTIYRYRIRAFNEDGVSPITLPVVAKTK